LVNSRECANEFIRAFAAFYSIMKKTLTHILLTTLLIVVTIVSLYFSIKRLREKKKNQEELPEIRVLKIHVKETGLTYDLENDTVYKMDSAIKAGLDSL